jgi:hypothetical protein
MRVMHRSRHPKSIPMGDAYWGTVVPPRRIGKVRGWVAAT